MSEQGIALKAVSVFYGEVVGLSCIDLELGPGITGLVGPNGSGKTTFMRSVTGLLEPREGTVRVLGENPFTSAHARSRISLVPATECFLENASARRNLEIAFLARGHSTAVSKTIAQRALERVSLVQDGERAFRTWSRGMRQRLKLGLALTADVDIVLLDEPFLGVDPPSRHHLKALIKELGDAGRCVVISSHVLHEIEALTHRVGILAHGRLLGHGDIETLLATFRERFPQRILIDTADPRRLAGLLVGRAYARSVVVLEKRVELLTVDPEAAFAELPKLISEEDLDVRGLSSQDQSLDALFSQVTEAGAQLL
ncbi:MAG: hypothetical protein AUK47_21560 [Deltaproteobacteria bacterium CG2_30_63_29]|nr:MAG: hypothetical protein AUK47_21560 [Deltaproteobacteria bacterium CG2_30_63_29]PJB48690.1 MAG: hypothetical protein CO108_01810 [Deltaproteobacteria bacterium CG_4_9_14_3_um_filter_63_12]